jgi:hypothetical protein
MVRQVETELLAVSAGDHISAALSSALSELGATDKGLSCVRTAEGQYVIKAPEPGRGIKEATISVKVSGEVRCLRFVTVVYFIHRYVQSVGTDK